MNQQPPPASQPPSRRVYTEEERRLRWALIIEAILHDPSFHMLQERQASSRLPAPEPKQSV